MNCPIVTMTQSRKFVTQFYYFEKKYYVTIFHLNNSEIGNTDVLHVKFLFSPIKTRVSVS